VQPTTPTRWIDSPPKISSGVRQDGRVTGKKRLLEDVRAGLPAKYDFDAPVTMAVPPKMRIRCSPAVCVRAARHASQDGRLLIREEKFHRCHKDRCRATPSLQNGGNSTKWLILPSVDTGRAGRIAKT